MVLLCVPRKSKPTKLCPLVGSGVLLMDHPKDHSLIFFVWSWTPRVIPEFLFWPWSDECGTIPTIPFSGPPFCGYLPRYGVGELQPKLGFIHLPSGWTSRMCEKPPRRRLSNTISLNALLSPFFFHLQIFIDLPNWNAPRLSETIPRFK